MHVYLSYASAQTATARVVRRALAGHGVEVWPNGDSGRLERDAAIRAASAFVAIVSNAFLRSKLSKDELALVRQVATPVAAVLAEDNIDTDDSKDVMALAQSPIISLSENGMQQLIELPCIPRTRPYSAELVPGGAVHEARRPLARSAPNRKDVFISYVEEDADDAAALRHAFAQNGISFWDFKAAVRRYDKILRHELQEAIENCRVLVAIQSDHYDASPWTNDEYSFAEQLNLPVLLVRFRHRRPKLLGASRTIIDCIESRKRGLDQVIQSVRQVLAN
jgi:hypothetical protein